MAEETSEATVENQGSGTTYGLLAQLPSPERLMHACARMRDEGFTRWDAHTPFPIHGLDRAMGLKRSMVSVFVLVLGLSGAAAGMLLQWWTSAVSYPLVISGKPFFSWPAFVPIMFECGVLGGATGALLGLFVMGKLPQHHHALFNSERFAQVTDDGFFISVEMADPKFDSEATTALLREAGATHIETVLE